MDDPPGPASYAWLVLLVCIACLLFIAYRRRHRWLGDTRHGLARQDASLRADGGVIGHLYEKAHQILFRGAVDVREAVERGLDRGVRLSTDDLPSRHEFISGSPSSVGSPTLAAERDALPTTGLPRLDTLSSPTMDRHVNVLKSMAHPNQTPGTHGAGLGLDLSSDMDPLGASSNPTELPAARRTLSSNLTASVAAPANVSSKAARLLSISDQRQNLQGRYTDEDVPPKAGRLLGLAPGSGAGADAGARAESRAAAGALPGTRRSASGRGGAGRIAGGRGGTGGSTDEDSEDDDGSSEGSERGAGGGDAKWVITDDD